ncbi:ATP phosphoribosyltransferase [Methylopila jiangsuensis]|uniref:ATP phosphoribosyltransferase n=1 Tax=Methylopila jiangsuensis TaxID=586230 RepID=A0A9W6JGT8_9HYPH|nr:ATP phosphoribosyltransferase [Methylopila jiangsuensis]MDR6286876.1 ATP phosphoribosyltransferase [Methylopila jiangsuensis]GLK76777.1 ATP phosphoribosyltransferase [Methylopila jiangsuensis]
MTRPLILAVPSKGRLQENAQAFFARAGLHFTRPNGARDYRGGIADLPAVEIAYLSASDIASQLASGGAHLGVTGEDLIREQIPDAATRVKLLQPLGFGHADVVVAAPKAWIDVNTMADLDDVAADLQRRHGRRLRVATKYVNLTHGFFAWKDRADGRGRAGVSNYRIVESLGATEGAPAAGAADVIVDITSTGATLSANALKILSDGVILRSQAHLVAGLSADWSDAARTAARVILTRIAAEVRAREIREVRARFDAGVERVLVDVAARFDARAPFGPPAPGTPLTLHAPKKALFPLIDALTAAGAGAITVATLEDVFEPNPPLVAGLFDALAGKV